MRLYVTSAKLKFFLLMNNELSDFFKSKLFKPTTTKKKKNNTKRIVNDTISYNCSFRLPFISLEWRKRVQNTNANKIANYDVHYRTNLKRLEYALNKLGKIDISNIEYLIDIDHTAKKRMGNINSLSINSDGWIMKFNSYLIIRCKYLPDYYRKYTITFNDEVKFNEVLDAPVVTQLNEDDTFDED